MLAGAASIVLLLLAAYLVVYGVYYTTLALVGLWPVRRRQGGSDPILRFVSLVPAHNEEQTVTGVIRSLQAQAYPPERNTIVVLADNCTDDTAGVAASAGARAIVRGDPFRPGKGAALEWAFVRLLSEPGGYDAICVFDADNRVEPGFLAATGRQIGEGADAVQGYIDTKNPGESLLSGVGAIAYYSANRLFQLPRARLGLSAVLGGTGVCFSTRLLRRVGWGVSSLTEDLEYQAKLTLAGVPVRYAYDARVFDEKPASAAVSMRQRLRWMQGYWDVLTRYLPRLVAHGIRTGSARSLELAVYTMAPPRSLLAAGLFGMGVLALLLPSEWWIVGAPAMGWFAGWLAFSLLPLLALPLEHAPARVYASVPLIPVFALSWLPLVVLGLVRRGRKEWSHTRHSAHSG